LSLSTEEDVTARLTEEDSGAVEEVKFSFAASFSNGESLQGGASYEGLLSNALVKVGVSGISGSRGGLSGFSPALGEAGDRAGKEAGGVERRWSRRQYEKTVDEGILVAGPEPVAAFL
jgi:hypothetical protein